MSKILIAAPLGSGKEYSINEWFQWIAEQSHRDFDVVVCVNGHSQKEIDAKVRLLERVEICDRPINVISIPYDEYHTMKKRIMYAREAIRVWALNKGEYSHIFWLDSDTIPFFLDAIPQLLKHEKDIVSGLYFYKNTKQPVIIDIKTYTNFDYDKLLGIMERGELVEVWGFGMGCVLMKMSAIENVKFDYGHKREDWSEDFVFCELLEMGGVSRWFDPRVVCKHYHRSEFSEVEHAGTGEHERTFKDESEGVGEEAKGIHHPRGS